MGWCWRDKSTISIANLMIPVIGDFMPALSYSEGDVWFASFFFKEINAAYSGGANGEFGWNRSRDLVVLQRPAL